MADLKEYYRHAVAERIVEIEDAIEQYAQSPGHAASVIRRASHSLRGSGGTYGFPAVTAAAAAVEDAGDIGVIAAARGLLDVLRGIVANAAPASRVLVIDDDPQILVLLRAILTAPRREIVIAETAEEGVRLAAAGGFDVILLDLLLPDGDGRSVLREIRRHDPADGVRPFIIVLSAKSAARMQPECEALGCDAFIEKPFDPQIITDMVQGRVGLAQ